MKNTEDRDQKPDWYGKHYSFFSNRQCEYFPCHPVSEPAEFNCLFCYCPLYALGKHCGGSFTYLENGFKDCSRCLLPHRRESYGYIIRRFGDLAALAQADPENDPPAGGTSEG